MPDIHKDAGINVKPLDKLEEDQRIARILEFLDTSDSRRVMDYYRYEIYGKEFGSTESASTKGDFGNTDTLEFDDLDRLTNALTPENLESPFEAGWESPIVIESGYDRPLVDQDAAEGVSDITLQDPSDPYGIFDAPS